MSTVPRRATAGRLVRHGRLPWPGARALLAGTTCAWSDLDGFHLQPADRLPEDTPVATHLWAWTTDTCFRLRLDDGHALVASLHLSEGGDHVHVRPARSWGADDRQVGPLPAEAHGLELELLELTGRTPALFVRTVP